MTKGRSLAAPTQEYSRTEPADARGNQCAIAEEFGLVIPGERDVLPYVWASESNIAICSRMLRRMIVVEGTGTMGAALVARVAVLVMAILVMIVLSRRCATMQAQETPCAICI